MKPPSSIVNAAQQPSASGSGLACHTLEDLRAFLHAFTAITHRSLKITSALRILQICSPGGLSTQRVKNETYRIWIRHLKPWCRHHLGSRSIQPLPGTLDALSIRSPEHARSMYRVLHQLVVKQRFPGILIGVLIHCSAPGGQRRWPLSSMPWCRDVRNQPLLIARAIRMGLLRSQFHWFPHANRYLEVISLSGTGQSILLGHWGKAMPPLPPVPQIPTYTNGLSLAA